MPLSHTPLCIFLAIQYIKLPYMTVTDQAFRWTSCTPPGNCFLACYVTLKFGGSSVLTAGYIFCIHHTHGMVWYFARIFIANGWLAFIHQTNRIQKAKFSTFFLERTLVNTIVRHSVQSYNSHCRQNSTQNQRKILHVFIGNFWNLTTF